MTKAPAITWLILVGLSWLHTLVHHGEPKDGKHDIGMTTAGVLIAAWLLWWGGFFEALRS